MGYQKTICRGIKHCYVYIYRRDSKKPYYNEVSDGCVILLPITYAYQSDDIRENYESKFVADTLHHKIFLLTDGDDIPTWNKFRENLKASAAKQRKYSKIVE